jgi:CRP/FNR family cyclic AMP-dependent transcriptional regulator
VIFHQGAAADSFYYLPLGKVQLSVVSEHGKEAIIALLETDEVFGESCLLGLDTRRMTATALAESRIIRVTKDAALKLMASDTGFDQFLLRHVLRSSLRTQERLLDQLFNSSEKRLARTLLTLANYVNNNQQDITIPKISQEALAEMVGSTRPRINQFMNKFRRLGYINYNGTTITVNKSLLTIMLCEATEEAEDTSLSSRKRA